MSKLFIVFLALIFSSCAVISTSQFESAKTHGEGNGEIGFGGGFGRAVSWEISKPSDIHNIPSPVFEFFGETGITAHIDVGAKMWIAGGGIGVKGSSKFQLSRDDAKFHFAFAPALSWTGTDVETNVKDKFGYVSVTSVHLPIFWSTNISPVFALYGGFHYVYSHISLRDWNGTYSSFDHHSPGIVFGFQFIAGPVVFMPECSFLLVRDFVSGVNHLIPFPNFGVGFTFK